MSGSLGGQNTVGRHTGARSSRARSTLFRRLRSLDRRISALDAEIRLFGGNNRRLKLREELDAKRKRVREIRKGRIP